MAKLLSLILFYSFLSSISCQRAGARVEGSVGPVALGSTAGVGASGPIGSSAGVSLGAGGSGAGAHLDVHVGIDHGGDSHGADARGSVGGAAGGRASDDHNRGIDPATGRYNPRLDPSSASYDPYGDSQTDSSRQDPYAGQPSYDSQGQPVDQGQHGEYDPYNRDPYANQGQDASTQEPRYDSSRQDVGYDSSRQDPRQDPSRQDPPYDPYRADPRQDPRYGPSGQDPRYDPNRQPAGYDSRGQAYPPALKSLVMSENNIYLWWTDPRNPSGGRRQQTTGTASPTAVKYSVKYSKVYQPESEQTQEVSSKELNLQDLEPGTDYSFSVKVAGDSGSSGWSAPVRNRTLDQMPSQAPSNIKVEPRDRDATISISPPEGFKGYISQYLFLYAPSGGSASDRKWTEQQVSGYSQAGGPITIQLRNLQPGEEYFYTVQAMNSRGSSPFSEIQSFRTPAYQPSGGRDITRSPYPDYNRYPYPTPAPYPARPDDRYPYPAPAPYDRPEDVTTQDPYANYYTTDYYNRQPAGYGDSDSRYSPYWESATAPSAGGVHAGGSASISGSYDSNRGGSSYGNAGWSASGPNAGGGAWAQGSAAGVGSQSHASSGRGAASGSGRLVPGLAAPTDVKIDPLDAEGELIVLFNAVEGSSINGYEVFYSYDRDAIEENWQRETAPADESQAIVSGLTPNSDVYFKVRAITSDQGHGEFSETLQHHVAAARGGATGDQGQSGDHGAVGSTHGVGGGHEGNADHQQGGSEHDEQYPDTNEDAAARG